MCELFGFSSSVQININDLLKRFYAHCPEHPHGWGLVYEENGNTVVEKEPVKASESAYLEKRLQQEIGTELALAHIRYATIGNVEYKNCHPYRMQDIAGRRWILIHNGTIFEYESLNPYLKTQMGDTDSERILRYLIDCMNEKIIEKKRNIGSEERFEMLDVEIRKMAKGNKLNLMIYDGEILYVHTNLKDSLYYCEKENSITFATTPLTKESWEPVPFMQVLGYQKEKLLFQGVPHQGEYIETEDHLKFLYQAFAGL